jgi:hypothetical protein
VCLYDDDVERVDDLFFILISDGKRACALHGYLTASSHLLGVVISSCDPTLEGGSVPLIQKSRAPI